MAALTVDFRKHSGPTPEDDMAAQIITDCGNFTLDFKQHGFCASPLFLQTLGPWFPNEIQNLLSSEKRTLDHWVLFLHSPGKTLLTLSLVQKWLGSPFPEDIWAWWLLMHWLQLQSTPCEALPSVWISFAWLYSQACGHPCCLCTFSYPNYSFQSTLHLICFDTALCKQPHLSVMTLCDLPSLWRVGQCSSSGSLPSQQSSPLLWFQRTRDTQNLYCMNSFFFLLISWSHESDGH